MHALFSRTRAVLCVAPFCKLAAHTLLFSVRPQNVVHAKLCMAGRGAVARWAAEVLVCWLSPAEGGAGKWLSRGARCVTVVFAMYTILS